MGIGAKRRMKRGSPAVFLAAALAAGPLAVFPGVCDVSVVLADDGVPASRQAVILLRALAYDANLKARARDAVNIAILYRRGHADSERTAGSMAKAFGVLEATQVSGLPILVSSLPFTSVDALRKSLSGGGIDLMYVCGGLESELNAVMENTRHMKVLSVGSSPELVRKGLSIGVFEMDAKCTILLNLVASRSEGAAFAADLLRLAKIVR
jgi:hypothetical protein